MISSYKDLEVYKRSFRLAMDIFWISREFPRDEIYSLTSQITRASRSVSLNISEGWVKRQYDNVFRQHLINALGSNTETESCLDFALECHYINQNKYNKLADELNQIGKMLNKLHQNWKNYEK
jgi:four helix bundle protein